MEQKSHTPVDHLETSKVLMEKSILNKSLTVPGTKLGPQVFLILVWLLHVRSFPFQIQEQVWSINLMETTASPFSLSLQFIIQESNQNLK